jgi:uncharacterized metal-binding protein
MNEIEIECKNCGKTHIIQIMVEYEDENVKLFPIPHYIICECGNQLYIDIL